MSKARWLVARHRCDHRAKSDPEVLDHVHRQQAPTRHPTDHDTVGAHWYLVDDALTCYAGTPKAKSVETANWGVIVLDFVTRLLFVTLICTAASAMGRSVTSLGRIEPHNGVYQVAGPSDASVVSTLRVEEGQRVNRGEILATLDTHGLRTAELKRAEVELNLARKVLVRQLALKQTSATSVARLEEAERDVLVREAELLAAQESLSLTQVAAPVSGQILLIHAREGERIGPSGLLELGQTQQMYVVAEVYETDIALVHVGQSVTVSSPALTGPITGKVERIGKIIGKNDILDLDPVARIDSRVVEVFILLDSSEAVSSLTYLQVDVEIHN